MEKLLTVKEAAAILGVKEQTLHLWASQRRIPHYRLGRKAIRFDPSEVAEWIQNRRIEASASAQAPADRLTRLRLVKPLSKTFPQRG